jgi:ankyrin repeat protein
MKPIWTGMLEVAIFMALAIVVSCGLCMPSGCASDAKTNSTPQSAADKRQQELFKAAQSGHRDRVQTLLGQGAEVNGKDPATGRTALHFAAANGHPKLSEFLLARGADVNAQDSAGNTPLHLAAMGGHKKTATLLLQASADRTIRNNAGKTAAEVAYPSVRVIIEDWGRN